MIAVNPTADIELAASKKRSHRIAAPDEARRLIRALALGDRATWATAFYAGLRRGELRALRFSDVDLGRSEIRVVRSWDQVEGAIDPKSETSARTVPLMAALRDYLDEHKLATGRDGDDLVFGRSAELPFVPSSLRSRALTAWKAAELEPIKLHDARHTFASTMIDAEISNVKSIQEAMGHASVTTTLDLYGHLLPGNRDQVRAKMDAYLERALADAV